MFTVLAVIKKWVVLVICVNMFTNGILGICFRLTNYAIGTSDQMVMQSVIFHGVYQIGYRITVVRVVLKACINTISLMPFENMLSMYMLMK